MIPPQDETVRFFLSISLVPSMRQFFFLRLILVVDQKKKYIYI